MTRKPKKGSPPPVYVYAAAFPRAMIQLDGRLWLVTDSFPNPTDFGDTAAALIAILESCQMAESDAAPVVHGERKPWSRFEDYTLDPPRALTMRTRRKEPRLDETRIPGGVSTVSERGYTEEEGQ